MNLPGAYPASAPDARPFQNSTPRGSSDRDPPQRQSYQNPSNQGMERYNQENGALPNMRPSVDANSQSQGSSRRPSGPRICAKCNLPLSGQFVRALDNTYHLECFTCQVMEESSQAVLRANPSYQECGKIVASKFFPVPDEGPNQYPLCETDYFRRLDLICHSCDGALRGSYITALDRKYHIEHFTCSVCPTVFGAQDSYYEHEGLVYCHYHYSTKFAQRCQGCQNAILKQFVEIFRNGQNQHWHPECYMIHKYWNVRLSNADKDKAAPAFPEPAITQEDAPEELRKAVRADEEKSEEKVLWIWRTLSGFEEKSAQCISEMLVNVSSGKYIEGIQAARKFIVHVELFFESADELDQMLAAETPKGVFDSDGRYKLVTNDVGLSYGREAKLLCKKIVNFFQLLSKSVDAGMQRLGVTQELLSLVTGLAHYLKLLIRICLQGALRLERETGSTEGLRRFLDRINTLEDKLEQGDGRDAGSMWRQYVHRTADSCPICDKPVEDKCAKQGNNVFHLNCLTCKNCGVELGDNLLDARWSPSKNQLFCSRCSSLVSDAEGGFKPVTRLQQYIVLLKVSHARLLATLQSSGAVPHTTDDLNLSVYDSSRGHRGGDDLALLRSQTRSQSYAGSSMTSAKRESTSYEQALGDIRRLRSTRLDKNLSNSMRRARSSRIVDGPGGLSVEPGAEGQAPGANRRQSLLKIEHDRDQNGGDGHLTLDMSSMALDDIPRLVAQEQAKEQRPNASKYARGNLVGEEPEAKLVNGHRRDFSGGPDNMPIISEQQMSPRTKYFSELSALEYFIVRHLAVLSMEPLLDGHFNQQELLELIETKRSTFWDKFKFKPDKGAGKKGKGVFGKALEVVCERDGADSTDGIGPGSLRVPAVVDNAVSAMRSMDMSVEGVFRKNGNIRRLKELSEEIDAKGSEAVDLSKETPVQVAALLKKFLRELPDPVLSYKLHRLFILGASKFSHPQLPCQIY